MGYGDFSPETLGARACESTACIGGGIVTTMVIIVMMDLLTLNKDQKKAFFDLSVSEPGSLVISSFFHYLQCKKSEYPAYNIMKAAQKDLENNMIKFIKAKKKAEIVSLNIITNEEIFEKKLTERLNNISLKINKITKILEKKLKMKQEINSS